MYSDLVFGVDNVYKGYLVVHILQIIYEQTTKADQFGNHDGGIVTEQKTCTTHSKNQDDLY